MAPPRQSNVRRRETSTGDFHELGVKGRKTGIELPDTGVRDEHGMQPIDGLFSSPEKDNGSSGDDMTRGEQDMELESESGPGPASIMKNHPRLVPRGTSRARPTLDRLRCGTPASALRRRQPGCLPTEDHLPHSPTVAVRYLADSITEVLIGAAPDWAADARTG
ncbi:cupin domain-containing protein [Colletotrichum tofieldiae]|nr:cupin domain-containing protein [Colletotrichum tofieldiae]